MNTGLFQTQDYLWGVVLLTTPATVTLVCGASEMMVDAPDGLTKLRLPLIDGCRVHAKVARNGATELDFRPDNFQFSTKPPMYNFNAFVAGGA